MSNDERPADRLSGRVVKAQSGFFTVELDEPTSDGETHIVNRVRGRLLENRLETDPVALGDRVQISIQDDGSGMVEAVEPRERAFARQMPSSEGRRAQNLPDREQVIIANPDQVVFVFAATQPEPRLKMLDRFLIIAERADIPALIVVNKIDLVKRRQAKELFALYDALGYPVIYTSAHKRRGIWRLRRALKGKVSAFTGPSGVGKSSLLNVLQPGLGIAVNEISEATEKGKHTTVSSEMYPLKRGGYVADTPGIRAIGLFNIEPSELDGYFRDIAPFIDDCRFADCRHDQEPGCGVREAAEQGDLWWERYESYLRLREEAEDIYYRC